MPPGETLMQAHRRKQAESRAEKKRRDEQKKGPPAARRFCDAREPGNARVCILAPGHDGDHDSHVTQWPNEPDNAGRWHCEARFIGTDGRERKCEARNQHEGPHYAWCAVHKVTVYASAEDVDVDETYTSDNADRWWWGWRGQLGSILTKKYSGDMAPVLDARSHPAIGSLVVGPFLLAVGEGEEQAERHIREVLAETQPLSASPTRPPQEIDMEAIDQIRHDRIEPDPNQPRKTFDQERLQELANSIGVHGIQSPIAVRPKPGKSGWYVIIFGERRWRAAELAGLDTVPCIVDVDAGNDEGKLLERQLVENAQRDDIHPLEEGEALGALHTKHGYSIDELMSKVGKSRSHVYARIKLTELASGVKKAMLAGRLPHAHGELIGRIPDHKLQEQCCKEVLGEVADKTLYEIEDLGVRHEAVNPDGERFVMRSDGKRQILSFRATAALVRRRYQTKLSLATFDPADATLTPAGACGPCPHNSANQPELPGVTAPAKPEGFCGNLPCFEKKTSAQFKRVADAARAEGKKVFEGKKAEAMFYNNGELKSESGFAAPDQRLPYEVVQTYNDKLTYKKLLGKHIAEVPTVIVQNERGAAVEVLDQKKAIEVLREHKLLPKKGAPTSKPSAAEKKEKEKRKIEKEKEKLREETFPLVITQAVTGAKDLAPTKAAAIWRWVAMAIATDFHWTESEVFAARRGLDPHSVQTELEKLIESTKSEQDLRALVVELLMCKAAESVVSEFGDTDELMELAGKLFGTDWEKAEQAALALRENKKKVEAAEKKADAKKKGGGK